jgi:hypothetical protein
MTGDDFFSPEEVRGSIPRQTSERAISVISSRRHQILHVPDTTHTMLKSTPLTIRSSICGLGNSHVHCSAKADAEVGQYQQDQCNVGRIGGIRTAAPEMLERSNDALSITI